MIPPVIVFLIAVPCLILVVCVLVANLMDLPDTDDAGRAKIQFRAVLAILSAAYLGFVVGMTYPLWKIPGPPPKKPPPPPVQEGP